MGSRGEWSQRAPGTRGYEGSHPHQINDEGGGEGLELRLAPSSVARLAETAPREVRDTAFYDGSVSEKLLDALCRLDFPGTLEHRFQGMDADASSSSSPAHRLRLLACACLA